MLHWQRCLGMLQASNSHSLYWLTSRYSVGLVIVILSVCSCCFMFSAQVCVCGCVIVYQWSLYPRSRIVSVVESVVASLQDTVKAMTDMGLSEVDMDNVFKVVACVLHLGNITFTEVESSGVRGSVVTTEAMPSLTFASRMLEVLPEQLSKDLTTQMFASRPDMPATVVSVQKACGTLFLISHRFV